MPLYYHVPRPPVLPITEVKPLRIMGHEEFAEGAKSTLKPTPAQLFEDQNYIARLVLHNPISNYYAADFRVRLQGMETKPAGSFLSEELVTVTMLPVTPAGAVVDKPHSQPMDSGGIFRSRSRFLTAVLNGDRGYFTPDTDDGDWNPDELLLGLGNWRPPVGPAPEVVQ